ncbi:MAG: kynureninase, partial [Chitinophagaceae bacterium]
MAFQQTLDYALEQDAQNASRYYRNRFFIPQHEGKDAVYFLGNSLGLQPKETQNAIQDVLAQWS